MTDFIAAIPQWVWSLLSGGGAGAFVVWYFKQRVKSGLDKDLEAFKDRLSRASQFEVERLRHEMAQAMVAAQLATTKMHEVYPKVMQAVRRAEGAVLSPAVTGTGFLPTYEGLGANQIRKVLEDVRLPERDFSETMELLQDDEEAGLKEVARLVRKRSIADARRKLDEERNYLVLEGMFLTKPVRELASQVFRTLSDALVDINMGFEHPRSGLVVSLSTIEKKLSSEIAQLEELMQQDLRPQPMRAVGSAPAMAP